MISVLCAVSSKLSVKEEDESFSFNKNAARSQEISNQKRVSFGVNDPERHSMTLIMTHSDPSNVLAPADSEGNAKGTTTCLHIKSMDTSITNNLVSRVVDVGNISDTRCILDTLPVRDNNSWNSIIVGYVKNRQHQQALDMYQKMQTDCSAHPVKPTFAALIKACAKVKDLKRGREIHAEIARMGLLTTDVFINSCLMDMYIKFDLFNVAKQIFDSIAMRDVVAWNALIGGYINNGESQKALDCFESMQLEAFIPNAITYVYVLKACGSLRAKRMGKQIHNEIATNGLLAKHVVVGNALIDMYVKFGRLTKAQEVFDNLTVKDVVTWNTLMTGYVKHNYCEKALNSFEQMEFEGVIPDEISYIFSLKACGIIGDLERGLKLHEQIVNKGFLVKCVDIGNALIDMYVKCGVLAKAQEVFNNLLIRDIISWNSLISAYVKHGFYYEAVKFFEEMQLARICPNADTYICYIKACSNARAENKLFQVHYDISRDGLDKDIVLASKLVDAYAKCAFLEEAQELFDELKVRDVVLWTALISGYAENGHSESALICFEQMQHQGVCPDDLTFVYGLRACSSLLYIVKGKRLHAEIINNGLDAVDNKGLDTLGTALVNMYAKCGLHKQAHEVFDELPVSQIVY